MEYLGFYRRELESCRSPAKMLVTREDSFGYDAGVIKDKHMGHVEVLMPTALELSREGWQHYLKRPKHKQKKPMQLAATQQERERLLALVHQAAEVLKTRYGAKRVILLGSLVRCAWFTPNSDVDLAVMGLMADTYWEAWRVVEDIIADRPVDLIDIEAASESMLRSIERYGIEL